jgi:ABC-type Mn2+/Zn2+ transport system ATPase subunit
VALLQRQLLASGPTAEVFTRSNLLRTFGLTDQLPA